MVLIMDTDDAWNSFIGIRKATSTGYMDTVAAALNDIKKDTANLARLTNQILGDQQMLDSSAAEAPAQSPAQDLAAPSAPAAAPADSGASPAPEKEGGSNGMLDDAMGMLGQQAAQAAAPEGMPQEEGGAPAGKAPADDSASADVPPEGYDGGMPADQGGVPKEGISFSTECIQFMDKVKEELQSASEQGDYFMARRLIEIITAIDKILKSDNDPSTVLKSEGIAKDRGEYSSADINTVTGKLPNNSDAGDYHMIDRRPKIDDSEGMERSVSVSGPLDMSKSEEDYQGDGEAVANTGMNTTSFADSCSKSDTGDIGSAVGGRRSRVQDEPGAELVGSRKSVRKSAIPETLPSFKSMLAHRRGGEEDPYVEFRKSVRKAFEEEAEMAEETEPIEKQMYAEPPQNAMRTPYGRSRAQARGTNNNFINETEGNTRHTNYDDEDTDAERRVDTVEYLTTKRDMADASDDYLEPDEVSRSPEMKDYNTWIESKGKVPLRTDPAAYGYSSEMDKSEPPEGDEKPETAMRTPYGRSRAQSGDNVGLKEDVRHQNWTDIDYDRAQDIFNSMDANDEYKERTGTSPHLAGVTPKDRARNQDVDATIDAFENGLKVSDPEYPARNLAGYDEGDMMRKSEDEDEEIEKARKKKGSEGADQEKVYDSMRTPYGRSRAQARGPDDQKYKEGGYGGETRHRNNADSIEEAFVQVEHSKANDKGNQIAERRKKRTGGVAHAAHLAENTPEGRAFSQDTGRRAEERRKRFDAGDYSLPPEETEDEKYESPHRIIGGGSNFADEMHKSVISTPFSELMAERRSRRL